MGKPRATLKKNETGVLVMKVYQVKVTRTKEVKVEELYILEWDGDVPMELIIQDDGCPMPQHVEEFKVEKIKIDMIEEFTN